MWAHHPSPVREWKPSTLMAAYTFPVTLAESTSMVTGALSLTARETGAVEAVRTQPLQSRNSPAHDSTQEFASHMR